MTHGCGNQKLTIVFKILRFKIFKILLSFFKNHKCQYIWANKLNTNRGLPMNKIQIFTQTFTKSSNNHLTWQLSTARIPYLKEDTLFLMRHEIREAWYKSCQWKDGEYSLRWSWCWIWYSGYILQFQAISRKLEVIIMLMSISGQLT